MYGPPLHGISHSGVQQQLPMVDPKYPLPPSLPVSAATQQSLEPGAKNNNGMAGTSTRRRKVSGRSQSQAENTSQATVPEVPQAPPVSYDYSYPNGSPTSPVVNNLATFAARARAAPGDLIPPGNLPGNGPSTSAQISRPVRQGSINRPPGAVYLEIRGTERKSLSSPHVKSKSSQYSSNVTVPNSNRETVPGFPRQTSSASTSSRMIDDTAHTQSRSASRRVSSGTGTTAGWASDRSPLQKLEVKLNDISKEEKRARVEEAEHLLRMSKADGQSLGISRQVGSTQSRSHSARASSATYTKLNKDPLHSVANSQRQTSTPDDHKAPSGVRRVSEQGVARSVLPSDSRRYASGPAVSPQAGSHPGGIPFAKLPTSTSVPLSDGIPEFTPQPGQQFASNLNTQDSKASAAAVQRANGQVGPSTRESEVRRQRRSSVDPSEGERSYQEAWVLGQNEAQEAQRTMDIKATPTLQQSLGSIRKTQITRSLNSPTADLSLADQVNDGHIVPDNSGEYAVIYWALR